MKAREVLKKYDICRDTLCRWVKENKIEYSILPSGRYDYGRNQHQNEDIEDNRKTIIYARVSTSGQKDNLERQVNRLKSFASAKGFTIDSTYSEIASALNYNRKYYKRLLDEIMDGKVKNVVIEYKDRMLRIGFEEFSHICDKFKTNIIILDNTDNKEIDINKELTTDLISIIHHFSSKMYSLRRKQKQLTELITK